MIPRIMAYLKFWGGSYIKYLEKFSITDLLIWGEILKNDTYILTLFATYTWTSSPPTKYLIRVSKVVFKSSSIYVVVPTIFVLPYAIYRFIWYPHIHTCHLIWYLGAIWGHFPRVTLLWYILCILSFYDS